MSSCPAPPLCLPNQHFLASCQKAYPPSTSPPLPRSFAARVSPSRRSAVLGPSWVCVCVAWNERLPDDKTYPFLVIDGPVINTRRDAAVRSTSALIATGVCEDTPIVRFWV